VPVRFSTICRSMISIILLARYHVILFAMARRLLVFLGTAPSRRACRRTCPLCSPPRAAAERTESLATALEHIICCR